jgi:hypothetical protein
MLRKCTAMPDRRLAEIASMVPPLRPPHAHRMDTLDFGDPHWTMRLAASADSAQWTSFRGPESGSDAITEQDMLRTALRALLRCRPIASTSTCS